MKVVYPVIIDKNDFVVEVPDCNIGTEGENLEDAIAMARDAISLWCVTEQDLGQPLPAASDIAEVKAEAGSLVTLVDCDLDAYRQEMRFEEEENRYKALCPTSRGLDLEVAYA
jgi:predicted RNase H-like HicB family nuclease